MASGNGHEEGQHSGAPYIIVWLTLLALTGISYGVSLIHLGQLGFLVAMLIASTKATMVAMIFMHLRGERATPKIVMVVSVIFIITMAGIMIADVKTRYTFPENGLPRGYEPGVTIQNAAHEAELHEGKEAPAEPKHE